MKKLMLVLALVVLALPLLAPAEVQAFDPQADCFQCMQDCQDWQEPTRTQCEAWCYNTIPSCQW